MGFLRHVHQLHLPCREGLVPFVMLKQDEGKEQALAFASLMPLWEKLAAATFQADPFSCSPAWQLAFHETSAEEKRILFLETSGNLALFSEFRDDAHMVRLTPLEHGWCFGSPILGEDADEALAAVIAATEEEYPSAKLNIVLSGIQPQSVLAARLLKRFSGTFDFYRHDTSILCSASLAGGLDGYLSRRSANHRAKLRKAARKAAEAGVIFRREMPATQAELAALYARMALVESKSWKGIGCCGMTEKWSLKFYAALVQRMFANGGLRAIMAQCDGEDIGFVFGGLCGRTYRGQQFSYAATENKRSLGNLLQLETLKWLSEEGIERYDMGPLSGPRMEYKRHWTEKEHEIQTWVMVKKPIKRRKKNADAGTSHHTTRRNAGHNSKPGRTRKTREVD